MDIGGKRRIAIVVTEFIRGGVRDRIWRIRNHQIRHHREVCHRISYRSFDSRIRRIHKLENTATGEESRGSTRLNDKTRVEWMHAKVPRCKFWRQPAIKCGECSTAICCSSHPRTDGQASKQTYPKCLRMLNIHRN